MDSLVIDKLNQLNRQFYQEFARHFSDTRGRLQPGVRTILDQLPGDINALDLGCGNGSLACALVVGKQEYLNPPLRFPEEPVRHKILDFLGDLFLINCFPVAHFMVNRSGHLQNVKFLRELKETSQCLKRKN